MSSKVLILTQLGDVHAYAVAVALRHKGVDVITWHTTDFPTQAAESVLFKMGQNEIVLTSATVSLTTSTLNGLSTVWRRRPGFTLDEALLHPADQRFAETECGVFRKSLLDFMAPEAFWVNPHSAAMHAGSKLTQHFFATESGLQTPDTLYSNDPQRIRAFLREHPEGVIYKPFRAVSWRSTTADWAPYTSLLSEDSLVDDEILRQTPGIFQALVPKAFELRVTIMGQEAFTAKILSQSTERGKIDWRRSYSELSIEPYVLPEVVRKTCVRIMEALGLVFGCIDFIVTPAGDYVFLEINEMGQFLFCERSADLPLLDAFSDFLIYGKSDFRWNNKNVGVRYLEVLPKAESLAAEAKALHVASRGDAVLEGD